MKENYVRPIILHLQNGVSIAEGWYGSVHSNPRANPWTIRGVAST